MEITNETKILIGVLAGTVVIIVAGALLSGGSGGDGADEAVPVAHADRIFSATSHFAGPAGAAVTVTEVGDFQCPACGALHPVLQQVKQANPDVKFVYRHFPLTSIHEFARGAALASEAAAEQGKFFEYHDWLFENQEALAEEDLLAHADAIGLDGEAFAAALEADVGEDAVAKDISDGTALGLNSTPTLFINDVRYTGQ